MPLATTKSAKRAEFAKNAEILATNPAAFTIKTGRVGAFARSLSGEAIDLDVRRAQVVQGTRSVLLDENDEMYLSGAASSTVVDRMGDTLDATCQASMLEQSRGMTQFLDHVYDLPESILGTCVESSLAMATDPKQGDCIDLNIVIRIASDNERAVKCWRHVQNGVKLGLSIGGIFLDVDLRDEDDWMSGLIVHAIELLEISLVGVPANPRTYTKFIAEMTKGLRSNLAAVRESQDESAFADTAPKIRSIAHKSLHGGRREATPLNQATKATGTREDANDDEAGRTAPENPNATPTRDRPVKPEDSPTAAAHPTVGPPNADEPPAVPQVGTVAVTGEGQPREANPVSPNNAAPTPARFHGDENNDGHQGGPDQLASRPEQHAQQGVVDAPSGAAVTSGQAATSDAPVASAAPATAPLPQAAPKAPTDAVASSNPEAKGLKSIKTVDDSDDASAILPDGMTGDKMRSRVVKSMRAMKRSLTPGMHTESADHLRKAHIAIKSLLGPAYEVPGDAMLDDIDDPAQRSLPALEAKSLQLSSELDAKKTEVAHLETQLAELRATPTGRRSAIPGGSIQTDSEPLVPASAYYKSHTEQVKDLNHSIFVRGGDARDRA